MLNPLQLAQQVRDQAAAKLAADARAAAAAAAATVSKNKQLQAAQAGVAAAAAAAGIANPLAGLNERLQEFIDANAGNCTSELIDPLIGDGVLIESANVQYGGIGYTDYVYVDKSNPSDLHIVNQNWLWRYTVGLLLLVSGLRMAYNRIQV